MGYLVRQNPSPMHWDGRYGRSINKIFIHHAATTDFDGIGTTFRNKEVSAHYGVGRNNNVDQYVDESDAAWHCGVGSVNLESIGIENVNATGAPEWDVSDETFNTLVELVRNIAKRNGLFPVKPEVNLFGHKDVYQTACPMKLYPRLQELADAVNSATPIDDSVNSVDTVPDQVLHIGEKFQFQKKYRVDALAFVGGTWQIQCNELCSKGFTWNDNGVPTEPILEVSGGAGNPNDQVLQVGSNFEIPGTFTVLNLGYNDGMWLAEITDGGWTFWVDIATVTEV